MSVVFEMPLEIRYYETDAQGVVHHANYFKYFELARVKQLESLGHSYAELERDGYVLVVSKIHCRYMRPARFGDTLRILIETTKARAARIDHRYSVFIDQTMIAEGESTIACIDREGNVQRLPDYLQAEA